MSIGMGLDPGSLLFTMALELLRRWLQTLSEALMPSAACNSEISQNQRIPEIVLACAGSRAGSLANVAYSVASCEFVPVSAAHFSCITVSLLPTSVSSLFGFNLPCEFGRQPLTCISNLSVTCDLWLFGGLSPWPILSYPFSFFHLLVLMAKRSNIYNHRQRLVNLPHDPRTLLLPHPLSGQRSAVEHFAVHSWSAICINLSCLFIPANRSKIVNQSNTLEFVHTLHHVIYN